MPPRATFVGSPSPAQVRCTTGTNGASWQAARVLELQAGGMERVAALHRMLREYGANMHSNAPVHTWDK